MSPYRLSARTHAPTPDDPVRAAIVVVALLAVIFGTFAALVPAEAPCLATVAWDRDCRAE